LDSRFPKNMSNVTVPSMQDLLTAGVHFGHKTSRGNPRMKNYIFGAREGVHIIDLASSEEKLNEAAQAAYNLGKSGKTMLIIGTKKQAQEIVKELADEVGSHYANVRWVAGQLTNFDEVRKNFKKLNDLQAQLEKGELSRYTKKEQLLISKKLQKYHDELGGVALMEKLPDAVFVIDAVSDNTAVKEALRMNIPIMGLCDSNADPNWFEWPVPANDDGIKSIKLIAETLIRAYGAGKKVAGDKVEAPEEPKKEAKAERKVEPKEKNLEKVEENIQGGNEAQVPEQVAEVESADDSAVAEETAIIEEEVEKEILAESERKV
jgi:small subunit ribosomal protein S2